MSQQKSGGSIPKTPRVNKSGKSIPKTPRANNSDSESYVKCQGKRNGIACGRRQRSSNFYITINTNKSVGEVYNLKDTEREYINKFDKIWKDFFDQPADQYINVVGREPGDTLDNSVREMIMDGQTEYLSSGRRLVHAHILLQIKHYTKLQFNARAFREYLTKEMNLPSTYVHVEHVSDFRVPSLLEYIHKESEGDSSPDP